MIHKRMSAIMLAVTSAIAACTPSDGRIRTPLESARADSIARATQDSFNRAQPGYIVDSIRAPEEDLRRFRTALGGDSAEALVGGSMTREALVRRFVKAVAANDTSALLAMVVRGREFADLVYMDSPYSHPPYQQPADLAWRMIQDPSSAGLAKIIQRLGGKPMTFVSEKCDPRVLHEGAVTRYAGCLVHVIGEQGDSVTRRFYGSIIERGGQFKFLSYTNDF